MPLTHCTDKGSTRLNELSCLEALKVKGLIFPFILLCTEFKKKIIKKNLEL